MKNSYDIIIVGAGIVGLTLARSLAKKGHKGICVLEKETEIGLHSSGRNSGVLHAGIYYGTDSLKAKVCASGARMMKEFAAEHGIAVHPTGKVIVAQSPEVAPQIDVLFQRARANGIRIEKIDEARLKELEPAAVSHGPALYSPDTAVIDSKGVLKQLESELLALGVEIRKADGVRAIDAKDRRLRTSRESLGYGHLFNSAGLHADRVAHWMGVGRQYRILPFKGIYRKLRPEAAERYRGSIYPAPDLRFPFLGVHITRNAYGDVLVGPTAIPAFGRENYTLFGGLSLRDLPVIARDLSSMYLRNQDNFRSLVAEELGRYGTSGFVEAARALSPALREEDLTDSGKVGLRAQLVDERRMKLVMDFLVEEGPHSTHILNAISPAFTGSFAFAEYVVEKSRIG